MELDIRFREKLIMRMEKSSILSIGATSSVLVPHPCISIISTIPLSKGRCNYGPHESATGEVSYVTDPLMGWKQHHKEFPDPNYQTRQYGKLVHCGETKRELKRILICECRCNERLKSKPEGSTRLASLMGH